MGRREKGCRLWAPMLMGWEHGEGSRGGVSWVRTPRDPKAGADGTARSGDRLVRGQAGNTDLGLGSPDAGRAWQQGLETGRVTLAPRHLWD